MQSKKTGLRSETPDGWLSRLRDSSGKAKIVVRIER